MKIKTYVVRLDESDKYHPGDEIIEEYSVNDILKFTNDKDLSDETVIGVIKGFVQKFNETLKPGERKRKLISISKKETEIELIW